MTDSLTGRTLDLRVAQILGYRRDDGHIEGDGYVRWYHPDGGRITARDIPAYTDANCRELAPVLAWLTENMPTKEEVAAVWRGDLKGFDLVSVWSGSYFAFSTRSGTEWIADIVVELETPQRRQHPICTAIAPTIPEAACRLLVSWSERKSR